MRLCFQGPQIFHNVFVVQILQGHSCNAYRLNTIVKMHSHHKSNKSLVLAVEEPAENPMS